MFWIVITILASRVVLFVMPPVQVDAFDPEEFKRLRS